VKKIGVVLPATAAGSKELPLKVARMAADMGYHSFWAYENIHSRDPVIQFTQVLEQVPDIKVGFGCLNPFVRTPLTIAMSLLTLEESYPGRTILGLGTGLLSWLDCAGVRTKFTHTGMREAVRIIRSILRGEDGALSGKVYKVHDLKTWLRPAPQVPIYLVPRENMEFAEICGEIGDGCFGPIGKSSAALKRLFEHIRIGLKRSGRTNSDYVFANNICTVADRTEAAARDTLFSHPQFAHALGVAGGRESWVEGGLEPSLYDSYREAEAAKDFATTGKLLANTNAHRAFGICGTREQAAGQIKGWVDAVGLDIPVLSLCAQNEYQVMESLAAGRLYAEQG
jgi:alkanesulfonate monooxygenase SsuD/methylene tetrahydromethanopterin reductase-like flavin-dependent oxidoreductase (luciferase family)